MNDNACYAGYVDSAQVNIQYDQLKPQKNNNIEQIELVELQAAIIENQEQKIDEYIK